MTTIIAEKPSVALELARVVGARKREDGYMSGGGYAVTWAYGHLLEIFTPECDDWGVPLPYLPETFGLRIGQSRGKDGRMHTDPGYAKQLKVIASLFAKSSLIINAGDAGREGELIQRYIYKYVGSSVPVKRLWVSSLSDEALRGGLSALLPSEDFDNLYLAGKARNEADWLVGINATRALTKVVGGGRVSSLGRVQTPTLALICRRFLENRDFVPEAFWRLSVQAVLGNEQFLVRSEKKFNDRGSALLDLGKVQEAGFLKVDSVERKDEKKQPPLLYDLTALQRDANRRCSLTAQETLNAAQYLYEKKLITYPRTGSRYISDDVFRTVPALLKKIAAHNPKSHARALLGGELNRHSVNATKVTDHHALLPTGLAPDALPDAAARVYDLILTRFFEAFSGKCELIVTKVRLSAAGVNFTATGSVVITPGWKAIRGEKEILKDEDGVEVPQSLPAFREGDACRILSTSADEGQTKPKPVYTEESLLEAMEYAGREVEDEDLKEAIMGCGLGTPATRAGEIETIVRRGYIERQGKKLIPTGVGLSVYEAVKDKSIADIEMTARWEQRLSEIADGKADAESFDREIRDYTRTIVSELLSDSSVGAAVAQASTLEGSSCPMCGRAIMLTTRLARCVDDNCGWKIWRTVAGKTITESMLKKLLDEGVTPVLKGFKSKTGKPFNASLRLKDGEVTFEFPEYKAKYSKRK